jgi:hypothetical protein
MEFMETCLDNLVIVRSLEGIISSLDILHRATVVLPLAEPSRSPSVRLLVAATDLALAYFPFFLF